MPNHADPLIDLKRQITELRSAAEQLAETGRDIPAVVRNVSRVLASIKMLELNIVDALETEMDS